MPKQIKANGLKRRRAEDRRERACATSCATTRANPACATSSARSPRSARKVVKELALAGPQAAKKGGKAAPRSASPSKNLDKYLGVRRYDFGRAEERERSRPGHRPGLDRSRRRPAADRSDAGARQGPADPHRPARRRDAGVGQGRAIGRAFAHASAWAWIRSSTRSSTCTCTCPKAPRPRTARAPASRWCTALVSMLSGVPVRADVAMTGEITLRGRVLPIGGLKEKLLAALRGGIKTVIIPEENRKDLADIPKNVTQGLEDHSGEVDRPGARHRAGASDHAAAVRRRCQRRSKRVRGRRRTQARTTSALSTDACSMRNAGKPRIRGFQACAGKMPLV